MAFSKKSRSQSMEIRSTKPNQDHFQYPLLTSYYSIQDIPFRAIIFKIFYLRLATLFRASLAYVLLLHSGQSRILSRDKLQILLNDIYRVTHL